MRRFHLHHALPPPSAPPRTAGGPAISRVPRGRRIAAGGVEQERASGCGLVRPGLPGESELHPYVPVLIRRSAKEASGERSTARPARIYIQPHHYPPCQEETEPSFASPRTNAPSTKASNRQLCARFVDVLTLLACYRFAIGRVGSGVTGSTSRVASHSHFTVFCCSRHDDLAW